MKDMNSPKKGYRIGELAYLANVNPRTIDFYTREGLLNPLKREDTHQHRYYPESALDRLLLIKQLRAHHLSLAEIRIHLENISSPDQRQVIETLQSVCQQMDRLQHQLMGVAPAVALSDRTLVVGMTAEAMQKVATLTTALSSLLASL